MDPYIPFINEFKLWLSAEGKTSSITTEVARLKSVFVKSIFPHDDFAFVLTKKIELALTGGIKYGLKEIMADAIALTRDDMFNVFKNQDYHANCSSALRSYFKFIAKFKEETTPINFTKIWDEYQSFISSLPNDQNCFWEEYDDDTFQSGTFGRYYHKIKIEEKERTGGKIYREYSDADLYCQGEEVSSALGIIREINPCLLDFNTGSLKLITVFASVDYDHKGFRTWYDQVIPFFNSDVTVQIAVYIDPNITGDSISIRLESMK